MMALTASEKRRITQALQEAGSTLPCPRCGHSSFSLLDGFVLDFVQSGLRNMVVGRNNGLASVVTTCDRCGFMAQHALSTLDRGGQP